VWQFLKVKTQRGGRSNPPKISFSAGKKEVTLNRVNLGKGEGYTASTGESVRLFFGRGGKPGAVKEESAQDIPP